MSVFGRGYARLYETFYAKKDYRAECDLIENAWRRYASDGRKTLLDVGCGAGGHAIELASRGWSIAGVDRSAAMLEIARRNAATRGAAEGVAFHLGDAESFSLGAQFDVATLMFAVLGYLHENDALLRALRNVRAHVREGGLLMFDCWYGPAVLTERPSDRMAVLETGESRVTRFAHSTLDTARHVVEVHYRVLETSGERVIADDEETHTMRFFFPQELRLLLQTTGFEMLSISAFPTLDQPPAESTWNVFVVARAMAQS